MEPARRLLETLPEPADPYGFLDHQINTALNADVGFNNLVACETYRLDPAYLESLVGRYAVIREFQLKTQELFLASLSGDADPEIARLLLAELPPNQGPAYHRSLTARQHNLPVFFRTDEVAPGKLSEIQCPGSSWGLYEQLHRYHRRADPKGVERSAFPIGLAERFAESLKRFLLEPPVVHHLLDNASVPHGMRFFLQVTRRHGIRYFSYDSGVTPYDCNFVRSHDFVSLFHNNFAKERLEDCEKGRLRFDLPPSILFEVKLPMAFPFYEKTRHHYSDAVRSAIPFTQIVKPEGFFMEDGSKMTIDAFCRLPRRERDCYVKYAGSDVSLNWGSKGVFYLRKSGAQCRRHFEDILEDYGRGRYWILQKAHRHKETTRYMTRDREERTDETYTKVFGFYGPDGLMGVFVMQKPFFKVHGSPETVLSIAL